MKKLFQATTVIFVVLLAVVTIHAIEASAEPQALENLTVRMISAGHDHATAIMSDDSLWVWGNHQHRPVRVMEGVSFVAAGYDFTMAIRDDATLWAWGANSRGQLGNGTTESQHSPVQILDDVVYVSSGNTHAMAIRSDGTLWGWGANNWGKLGDGTTETRLVPVQIMDNVTAVVAGFGTTAALLKDGSLWAWGSGGGSSNIFALQSSFTRYTPELLVDNVISISGGSRTLFAQLADGSTWSAGELRHHNRPGVAAGADFSELEYGVTNVSVRQQHAIALREDGTVWTWGNNNAGQRGDGTRDGVREGNIAPSQVLDDVVAVSAGRIFSMALRSDGSLWAWGSNSRGQLGDDTTVDRIVPTRIIPFTPQTPQGGVAAVSAASHHTMAILEDGSLWAWGFNNTGQFGNGTTTNRSEPVQVGQITAWKTISAGTSHSAGIRGTGLWAWGANNHGELGDGTTRGVAWPVAVGEQMIFGGIYVPQGHEVGRWSKVAVGGGHTVAIREDGSLWTMGANGDGQLGDNTTDSRTRPVQIGEHKWKYIAANNFHTAAVREDGTLWTWGRNSHGQLGDGTIDNRHAPVQVGTDDNWVSVALGSNHTVAIRSDGSLWAWGSNSRGQLGDDTTDDRHLPIRVGTDNNWSSVSAGASHTVAIRTDSTLWGWGSNAGQLGTGTNANHHSPVLILENARAVSAGFNNTFVIKTDGSLWGFGDNGFSQLGDGTTTRRYEPIQIIAGIDGEGNVY
ncbi:MAG: hypothetical protein FWF78_02810 [Defluviitaleaceae bacterium]|nr:hypothetical protein [Defluviitaleaceae bacterium]